MKERIRYNPFKNLWEVFDEYENQWLMFDYIEPSEKAKKLYRVVSYAKTWCMDSFMFEWRTPNNRM